MSGDFSQSVSSTVSHTYNEDSQNNPTFYRITTDKRINSQSATGKYNADLDSRSVDGKYQTEQAEKHTSYFNGGGTYSIGSTSVRYNFQENGSQTYSQIDAGKFSSSVDSSGSHSSSEGTATQSNTLTSSTHRHDTGTTPNSTYDDDNIGSTRVENGSTSDYSESDGYRSSDGPYSETRTSGNTFTHTHVDLYAYPARLSLEAGARPVAPSLARLQAESSDAVTNLWHDVVHLSDLQRFLVTRLDGGHDRPALVELLVDEVRRGRLVLREKGEQVDNDQVRSVAARILDENLSALARRGLIQ